MNENRHLKDIEFEFEEITGVKKVTPISKEKVEQWLQSTDLEVLGAAFNLIMDRKCYLRIQPPLSLKDYHLFILHYLGRCLREDPDGEWTETRYSAGWAFVNWFVHLWNDKTVPRRILKELKDFFAKLYKESNEDIRTCIITAILEHLFGQKDIAKYFEDWRKDSMLRDAYDEAFYYQKHYLKKPKKKTKIENIGPKNGGS